MSDDLVDWAQDRDRFVRSAVAGSSGWDDAGPLAREFALLTGSLLRATTVAEALTAVVSAARTVIPSAHMASVTLREADGTYHTPVQTEPAATAIDQQQYRSGRGPCVESARPDGPAMAVGEDLTTDERWPEFAAASVGAGFLSVLATSLMPDGERPGALNLYSRGRAAFTPADVDRSLLLATHASLALVSTAAVSAADLERTQMRTAIASRDVIGQAKGILMARRGLTADEAFDVLRRTSQDVNVKLVELARTVTENQDALDAGRR